VGFGYAVANSVFGGTAPLLFSAAKEAGELTLFIGYVTVVIAASLIVYVFALSNRPSTMLDQPETTTSEPDLVAR
jgi:MHS family alpha-ketoglutarate permease-like MFS transporter